MVIAGWIRAVGAGLCLPALCLSLACGGGSGAGSVKTPEDPAARVIATVGPTSLTRGMFDSWLAITLGGDGESAAAGPEVKSRLLDQYLDEELLVAAAAEQGLTVSDDEIGRLEPEGAIDKESSRRRLLQKKYKEQVILKGVVVSPDEVRNWFEAHLQQYRRPAHVVIRQILVDTEGDARRIRAELIARPESFEEIASTRSLVPDSGQPTALEETILPEAIGAAVATLQPGELSKVVKDSPGYFILKLEERQPEQAPNLEEARQEIELALLSERSQKKYREFIAELRGRIKVAIDEAALDFGYVRKNPV